MVPFRRVRAMKVVTAYPAEYYGKFQMPIERSLAARFGEYLLREGLIRFTSTGSSDLGPPSEKITVTAHLGVVTPKDAKKAGAVPEVAVAAAPAISQSITERQKRKLRLKYDAAVEWKPPAAPWAQDEQVTDEFDEPKDAVAGRFSGLEID